MDRAQEADHLASRMHDDGMGFGFLIRHVANTAQEVSPVMPVATKMT